MRINFYILIWIVTLPTLLIGQDFAKVDTIQSANIDILKFINEDEIKVIETIDFTGDNKKDFIVRTKIEKNQDKICEYWISSDFKNICSIESYNMDIKIRKFINLDKDPELEIINASGYEDGIDYTVQNLNLKTGKLETILYFNPVIETETKNYWGYPWDWTKLKMKSNNLIKVSHKHSIKRDGNITIPKNQKIMPIIYFEGIPTQNSYVEIVQETKWLSINEIKIKSR